MFSNASHVFQDIVPQIAFQHPHLLDAILAASALHLAQCHWDRADYQVMAQEYYARALQSKSPELKTYKHQSVDEDFSGHRREVEHIDVSNVEAVYVSTIMICFQAFVALGKYSQPFSSYSTHAY